MSKLFQIELPLQAYAQTPGDLVGTLSHDGSYQIAIKLPQGVMSFSGASEEAIKKDILSAMRAMAKQDFVPDLALEVISEILTDLPYSIVQIDTEMEAAVKATPQDILSEFWGNLFPGGVSEIGAGYGEQVVEEVLEEEQSPIREIDTPFGKVRMISASIEDLPNVLRSFFSSEESKTEEEPKTQATPKFYS